MSLSTQRSRIKAWAEATDAHLVEVIEDAAVSGSRPLARRPGGARIARLLDRREPEIDSVVITRLDRLGRSASETLAHLHRFANGKVGLVSILDRLDLSTPQGRAMAGVAAVFGQLERELIAQRTTEALAQLQAQGRVYGAIPYGFRRKGDFLIADHNQQRVIEQILDLRSRGMSYRKVAERLNTEEIPAKRGGPWSAMAVRSICLTAARRDTLAA